MGALDWVITAGLSSAVWTVSTGHSYFFHRGKKILSKIPQGSDGFRWCEGHANSSAIASTSNVTFGIEGRLTSESVSGQDLTLC